MLDNSFRTVPRNKITRLNINEWLEVNDTIPGLLKTVYQAHRFIPGFSKRPSFETLRKNGIIDGKQVDSHIENCKDNPDCHLLRDIPIGFVDESDLEEDWDTSVSVKETLTMDQGATDDQSESIDPGQVDTGTTDQSEEDTVAQLDSPGGPSPGTPQMPVTSPEEEQMSRRVTRSMTKNKRASFYQVLLHQSIPQSAVLTFVHINKLSFKQQGKSILGIKKKKRLRDHISFAEHCLVTEFSPGPGMSWLSSLHKMI